jgi:hypothetical protein
VEVVKQEPLKLGVPPEAQVNWEKGGGLEIKPKVGPQAWLEEVLSACVLALGNFKESLREKSRANLSMSNISRGGLNI